MQIYKKVYTIFLGIIISSIYSYISVLMVYRAGVLISAALVTPPIFYLLLKIVYQPTKQEITLVQSIATGASVSVFCLDTAYASAVIFGSGEIKISIVELIILAIGMNLFGILISTFLRKNWINDASLPFPKARAVGEMINTLSDSSNRKETKQLAFSILGSGIVASLTSIFDKIKYPLAILFKIPTFIGVEISPLLFGLGMFLPLKTVSLFLVGIGYSLIVWIFKMNMISDITYRQFLFDPAVFSVAMGLAFGFTIYNIIAIINKNIKTLINNRKKRTGFNYHKLIYLSILVIGLMVFGKYSSLDLPAYDLLLILLICFFICLMSARLRAETGMAGSTPIYLVIPLIYLMKNNLETVLILSGGVILASVVSYSSLEANYVGNMTKTNMKEVTKMYTVGAMIGAFTGSVSILILHNTLGFGTNALPTPSSMIWGTFTEGIMAAGNMESINLLLLIVVGISGFCLSVFKIPSILIAIGILLPMSASISIFLGCLITKLMKQKNINISFMKVGAGLVTGEGIVSMIKGIISLV